ncbi:hypothetical protein [Peribacillus frigoritolerans]|uniref:hypothetical protein n=1 Tax=Peribacillus frigoritolerans TaxID=450367 RepID=UPI0032E4A423
MNGKVDVIMYENPYTFHELPEYAPFKTCPHICATHSLKNGLKRNLESNLLSATEVIQQFYPEWNDVDKRFEQYAELADLLRTWNEDSSSKIIQSFKRNQLNVLITMRNLTEIDLRPSQLRPLWQKREELVFCDVWEKMLPIFQSYMDDAAENLGDLDNIKSLLNTSENTVVLHGFYFITPVQHYVFSKWKEQGLNLVFINLYHKDYPAIFSFLEENFSVEHGWVSKEKWQLTESGEPSPANRMFASAFEGSYEKLPLPTITQKPYEYMIDFVQDIEEDSHYISPNQDELTERLLEFKPDMFIEERHFLSYPIGQYLLHLHSIWNEVKQDYFLTGSMLAECFASGWLEYNGQNARHYTKQLKAILPYLETCQTVDEWFNFLEKLKAAKRLSSGPIRKNELKSGDHFKAVRVNPVLRFSFLSVKYKDLIIIEGFIKKLVQDAKWLMNIEEERVTIKIHFNRIKQLLDNHETRDSLLGKTEKRLVSQLEEMLIRPGRTNHAYHIADLSDAIIVFLKTGLKDPDEEDFEEQPEDEKNIRIQKMQAMDGIIYRNPENVLHVCGMDEKHFPNGQTPMPWPLSEALLERLNYPAANMYLFRKNHELSFSKYLFYTGLCYYGEIQLSWIKNWNDFENLDRSIYVQLLDLQNAPESEEAPFHYVKASIKSAEAQKVKVIEELLSYPNEEFVEMNLCKRRFYYSSVADRFSTYESTFHQGFLIGNVVKLYASIGKTKMEIMGLLKILFPYMSEVRLRAIVDTNMAENLVQSMRKYGLSNRLKYEGVEYPESTMYFQYLTHRGAFQSERWRTSYALVKGKRRERNELATQIASREKILPIANPSEFCKLCPHAEYCDEAYYAVDISKKGWDDNDTDAS